MRRTLLAAAVLALASLAGPTRAELPPILVLEDGAGQVALLHMPPPDYPTPPIVIIVPDSVQRDLRHERYAEHLLASGFAVMVSMGEPAVIEGFIRRLRAAPAQDGARIGLLAFGAGAEEALRHGPMPRALLYPGCGHLPAPPDAAPLLLLHGDADPANPALACAAAVQAWEEVGAPVTRHMLRGASYAWDLEPLGGFRQALLPAPGQRGRVQAVPDPAITEQAADLVAQFFRELLGERGS
jgi:dienelactone hydrolase